MALILERQIKWYCNKCHKTFFDWSDFTHKHKCIHCGSNDTETV